MPRPRRPSPLHDPDRPSPANWPASQLSSRLTLPMPLDRPPPLRYDNPFGVLVQDLARRARGRPSPSRPATPASRFARTQRFADEPLPLLLESYERYGPVFTLRLFHANVVFMLGPAANHYITVSHASNFVWRDRHFRDLIGLLGDGLLTTDGDFHRRSRRIMLPAFHRERIARLARRPWSPRPTRRSTQFTPGHDASTSTPGPAASRCASPCARSSASTPTAPPRARSTPPRLFEQTLSFYAPDYALRMLRGPSHPGSASSTPPARSTA